jgi:hypothetical protein
MSALHANGESQQPDKVPMPLPKYIAVKRSLREKRVYLYKAEGVEPLDSVTPFKEDSDSRILELGTSVWRQYLETRTSLTRQLLEPSLADRAYQELLASVGIPDAGAIQTMNLYLHHRITVIFKSIRPIGKYPWVIYEHDTMHDDRFLWSIDNEKETRFAALVLFKPGTIQQGDFKRVMAMSFELESDFFDKHREVTTSVFRQNAVDIITELRNLYNNYGCCNVAACDFETLPALDLRPCVKPEHPGTFAKAPFIHLGGTTSQDWKHFQTVFLGFLERGYQWIEREERA